MRNKILLLSSCVLFCMTINKTVLYGQTSAGFFVERGQVVPFVFNSMTKLEQGITYTDWTRIRVKMQETTADALDTFALGWTLSFKASTMKIVGDRGVPADYLDLDVIRISSTDNSPFPPECNVIGLTDLTSANQTLASATPGVHVPNTIAAGVDETIIDVTYECGANNSGPCPLLPCNQLLGKQPDNYYVDIELTLTVP